MPSSVSSPADVVNVALARIGHKQRINDLYEGTPAAERALDIYGQTRDELIRSGDWDFTLRDEALTLVRQAPAGGYVPGFAAWSTLYPALPWPFSYAYPDDCLKVRAVKPVPLFFVDMDPQPQRWQIDSDPLLGVRVILSNIPNAVLTYTARITDPTQWPSDFSEALSAALGRRLAPALVGLEAARMELPDEAQTKQMAEDRQG